jgi:hypothetical protein
MHNAEYDSEWVKEEIFRLKSALGEPEKAGNDQILVKPQRAGKIDFEAELAGMENREKSSQKPSFWQRILGR